MARSALLAAVLTTTLAFVAAQPDLRSFVPSTASCPFNINTVTSPNQFAAARWCRLAEGGANTAITTAPSTPAVQTWGTRNWGNVYGGADGSGGPFSYRRYPLTNGGQCLSDSVTCVVSNSNTPNPGCGVDGPVTYLSNAVQTTPVCTSNSYGASSLKPTQCNTADSWGSVSTQCMIPGAGFPSYPWTLPLTNACDNKVITLDLVDKSPSPAPPFVPDFSYSKVMVMLVMQSLVEHITPSCQATSQATFLHHIILPIFSSCRPVHPAAGRHPVYLQRLQRHPVPDRVPERHLPCHPWYRTRPSNPPPVFQLSLQRPVPARPAPCRLQRHCQRPYRRLVVRLGRAGEHAEPDTVPPVHQPAELR
ncbi:hypothetical protein V8C86DRAFT_1331931 [Haematococcus lacustris]